MVEESVRGEFQFMLIAGILIKSNQHMSEIAVSQTVREVTLRELIESNSIDSVCVVGQYGGFAVTVRYGQSERTLASTRGEVRKFASLNTATDLLRRLGILKLEVDAKAYEPGRIRGARPDRAEALRRTRTTPKQQALL